MLLKKMRRVAEDAKKNGCFTGKKRVCRYVAGFVLTVLLSAGFMCSMPTPVYAKQDFIDFGEISDPSSRDFYKAKDVKVKYRYSVSLGKSQKDVAKDILSKVTFRLVDLDDHYLGNYLGSYTDKKKKGFECIEELDDAVGKVKKLGNSKRGMDTIYVPQDLFGDGDVNSLSSIIKELDRELYEGSIDHEGRHVYIHFAAPAKKANNQIAAYMMQIFPKHWSYTTTNKGVLGTTKTQYIYDFFPTKIKNRDSEQAKVTIYSGDYKLQEKQYSSATYKGMLQIVKCVEESGGLFKSMNISWQEVTFSI